MIKKILAALAIAISFSACTRIETGEVGLRVNASKEVQSGELMPGSWNQTIIGNVITFPTRDLQVVLENKTPLTKDNSALSDFDITVVYSMNPSSVSELYTTKSKAFHALDKEDGDILLMYNYITTLVNNASYKAVRDYAALEVADNRAKIEEQIRASVTEQLHSEKLDTALTIQVVQVRNVQPNQEILASATAYVRAQNELKVKTTEVEIAKKESERMAALSANSTQSIAFMAAQSQLLIAQGIKEGKVNTIVVPVDFKGMVNIQK